MVGRRIGIDVRALTPPVTGTGVYLGEILKRLAELAPENDYFCYTTRASAGDLLPPGRFHLRLGRGATARWGTVWLQSGLVQFAEADQLDLFWGPLQVVPLPLVGRLPTVVTLHDLVFHLFPETMSWRNRLALPHFARRSLRSADVILAVSEATAESAVCELGLDRAKLRVVYHGSRIEFEPDRRAWSAVLNKYGIGREFLLFVGTHEPRKNLDGLLRAANALIEDGRFDGSVVLVGTRGWKMSSLFEPFRSKPIADRIHTPGYVDGDDLAALYSAARLFVMPSHYEGFGLPILEAMSCGTAVVCSDRPPFPEITRGAARLFDANDESTLAEAIAEVWNDGALRRRLINKGRARAGDFSWEHSARGVLSCFEELLDDSPPERLPAISR